MGFHQLDCNLPNALQVFEGMPSRLELDSIHGKYGQVFI